MGQFCFKGLALLAVLSIFISPLYGQSYEVERYIEYYEEELSRGIRHAEGARSYEEYRRRLEIRLNMLRAVWEKDRDRIKAEKERSGESAEEVDLRYEEWEEEAEERIGEAKAEYVARHVEIEEEKVEEKRQELMELFEERYRRLLEEIAGVEGDGGTKGEVYQEYREDMVGGYEGVAAELEVVVGEEYERVLGEVLERYRGEGIGGEELRGAIEAERGRYEYERKVFLAGVLNGYMRRGEWEAYGDKRSLRLAMERERAREAREEIEAGVKEELGRSVEERLKKALGEGVMSEEEAEELMEELKGVYREGLEVWADAAARLVKREGEWYRSYDEVYREGMEAWIGALRELREKGEEWVEEFSGRIEEGLKQWEEAFSGMEYAKKELVESLNRYRVERAKGFDVYMKHIESVLGYGSGGVGAIDGYMEEFQVMMNELLSPFAHRELRSEEIENYTALLRKYAKNENAFWQPRFVYTSNGNEYHIAVPPEKVFDCKTHIITVSGASKKDKIVQGPYYEFTSEDLANGFRLNMKITCMVRRYWVEFDGKFEGWCFHHDDRWESRYYTIDYTHEQNKWKSTCSQIKVISPTSGYNITPHLSGIVGHIDRYTKDIIEPLKKQKEKLLESITGVQDSVVRTLEENESLLDDPLFTDEEAFYNHFFKGDKEFLMNDLDREVYKAYYDKEFWAAQESIVREALEYALDKPEREDAEETIKRMEEAKAGYDQALEEYKGLVEELREADGAIGELEGELEGLKKELSEKEKELDKALKELGGLKMAHAGLDLLVKTLYEQVSCAVEKKHDFFEEVFRIDEGEEAEAVNNLLKGTLEVARLQYDTLLEEYFDAENRASLVGMEEIRETFGELVNAMGAEGVSVEVIGEMVERFGELSEEMKGYRIYREIGEEVEKVRQGLEGVAAGRGEGEEVSRDEVLKEIFKEVSFIQRRMEGLIEAKREAYAEWYAHASDPVGYIEEEEGRVLGEQIEDAEAYVRGKVSDVSEMEGMVEELERVLEDGIGEESSLTEVGAYIGEKIQEYRKQMQAEVYDFGGVDFLNGEWVKQFEERARQEEVLDRFFAHAVGVLNGIEVGAEGTFEEGRGLFIEGMRGRLSKERGEWEGYLGFLPLGEGEEGTEEKTIEDYLIEVRQSDRERFLKVKELFYEVIPSGSRYERAWFFSGSCRLEAKVGFYGGILTGEKSPDIERRFVEEFKQAREVVEEIGGEEVLAEILGRLGTGYYEERPKGEVEPIASGGRGQDGLILTVFSYMEEIERNSMLNAKLENLLAAMAGSIASALYLRHGEELKDMDKGDPKEYEEALEGVINEKIVEYFGGLKEKAEGMGYTKEERERIGLSMERFLVMWRDEVGEGINRNLIEMSSGELEETVWLMNDTLEELEYYQVGGGYDREGYMKMLLGSERFDLLREAGAPVGVELDTEEGYERVLDYSEKLRDYLDMPGERRLKKLLRTGYITVLYGEDEGRAIDLVSGLSFEYIRSQEIPRVKDFEQVYEYIGGEFKGKVLSEVGITGGGRSDFIEAVAFEVLTKAKMYEAEAKRKEEMSGVRFSDISDEYVMVMEEVERRIDEYKAENNIYLEFDRFVEHIEGIEIGGGWGVTEEEVGELKEEYVSEERLGYARRYSVRGGEEGYREEYLAGYDEGFGEYLLERDALMQAGGYSEWYRRYLFSDPLEASFSSLVGSLGRARELLVQATERVWFKEMVEGRLGALVKGEYEDYRGVIYENRTALPVVDMEHLNNMEEVDPTEVSCSYNYIILEDAQREEVLSNIYFEGSGRYTYTYDNGEREGEIDTAVTYISGDEGVNHYIEEQNRFFQALVSLVKLKEISEETALGYLHERIVMISEDENGESKSVNLNVISGEDPRYSDIENITQEEIESMKNIVGALSSEILGGDADGKLIVNNQPLHGELLSMLASVKKTEVGSGELAAELAYVQGMVKQLEGEVNEIRGSVEETENKLRTGRENYNAIVSQVDEAKGGADEAYREYLAAKEKYFYATNIYLAGDDPQSAIEMYKEQVLEYAGKKAEAEERYTLLKEIKMREGEEREEDELAGLLEELKERNGSLNQAEEALQLLKILSYFVKIEEKRIEGLEERKGEVIEKNKRGLYEELFQEGYEEGGVIDSLFEQMESSLYRGIYDRNAAARYTERTKRSLADFSMGVVQDGGETGSIIIGMVKERLSQVIMGKGYNELEEQEGILIESIYAHVRLDEEEGFSNHFGWIGYWDRFVDKTNDTIKDMGLFEIEHILFECKYNDLDPQEMREEAEKIYKKLRESMELPDSPFGPRYVDFIQEEDIVNEVKPYLSGEIKNTLAISLLSEGYNDLTDEKREVVDQVFAELHDFIFPRTSKYGPRFWDLYINERLVRRLGSIESYIRGQYFIRMDHKNSIQQEINGIESLFENYPRIDFSQGTYMYGMLERHLREDGIIDVGRFVQIVQAFMEEKGEEIFRSSSGGEGFNPFALMIGELEGYGEEQEEQKELFVQGAKEGYTKRYEGLQEEVARYVASVSLLRRYETEYEVSGEERGFLIGGLSREEKERYDGYVDEYEGRWGELDLWGVGEEYRGLLGLEKRMHQLEELIRVYELLTGMQGMEEMSEGEEERWGEGHQELREKYGIEDEDILDYGELVKEGMVLDRYDLSEDGLLKEEVRRKKELYERVKAVDYYTMVTGSDLFKELLGEMREAHIRIGADRAELEKYRFHMQMQSLVEEKERFRDKVELGKEEGIEEWESQYERLYGAYRGWVEEMRELMEEGKEEWKEKKVEYVKRREEWIEAVKGGGKTGGLEEVEREIEELGRGIGMDAEEMRMSREEVEGRYIREVGIPQWVRDYEVLANETFGYMERGEMGGERMEESMRMVRERVEAFERKRSELEAEKVYYQLMKTREMIVGQIRGTDEASRDMMDEIMKNAGYSKSGEGYEKKIMVDYSLFGGSRYKRKTIGMYGSYRVDENRFGIGGVEELKRMEDLTDMKIYLMKETERLRGAKEEVLGTRQKVGSMYKEHIGRFPKEEEVKEYVEEKQEKKRGFFGRLIQGIKKIIGKVLGTVMKVLGKITGFGKLLELGKGGGEEEEEAEEFSAFQERLQGEISGGVNQGLETGRMLLTYQHLVVVEAEAEAKKDGGVFNAPLFPGGPSLKSIGSVALSVATGGMSLGASLAQVGWNAVTNVATAAEGAMEWGEAVLGIGKDIATRWATGGFSRRGGIAERLTKKSMKEVGSLSRSIGDVARVAAVDARRYMVNQAVVSGINAFEIRDGAFGWSKDVFVEGASTGMVGSLGAYGGSFAGSGLNAMMGARYKEGAGFGYWLTRDEVVYRNSDMMRMGGMIGGLTEQAINNVTGVSEGYRLNVVNSRMFGARNGVGMVEVSIGGSGGFSWDVGTGGVDVSVSGISGMAQGMREVERYKEVMGGVDVYAQEAYLVENLAGYAKDELRGKEYKEEREEIEELMEELREGRGAGIEFGAGENRRAGGNILLERGLSEGFGVEGGLVEWDMSRAAKLTSIVAHEWKHDGEAIGDQVLEDIAAHRFDAAVWKGLKERYRIQDADMDDKLYVYEKFGGEAFAKYLAGQYVLGEEASKREGDIGALVEFLRDVSKSPNSSEELRAAMAYLSVVKGFEGEEERYEKLREAGITDAVRENILRMIGRGYDVVSEGGEVEATRVAALRGEGLSRRFDGSLYMFMTKMERSNGYGQGALLQQQYVYDEEEERVMDEYTRVGVGGFGGLHFREGMENRVREIEEYMDEVNRVMDRIARRYTNEVQGPMREEEVAEGGYYGPGGLSTYWPRSGVCLYYSALCNIGSLNMIKKFGNAEYITDKRFQGIAEIHEVEKLANDLFDAMEVDERYEGIEEVIDLDKIKEECTTANGVDVEKAKEMVLGEIKKLYGGGYYTMLSMKGEPHGHIAPLLYTEDRIDQLAKISYDVNYSIIIGETPVFSPVTLVDSVGGYNRLNRVMENALKYGKFDFMEEWIEDYKNQFNASTEVAEQIYKENFKYEYQFYVPTDSVLLMLDYYDLWGLDHLGGTIAYNNW